MRSYRKMPVPGVSSLHLPLTDEVSGLLLEEGRFICGGARRARRAQSRGACFKSA